MFYTGILKKSCAAFMPNPAPRNAVPRPGFSASGAESRLMHNQRDGSKLPGKPVSASATELATLVEPSQTNAMGNIHGGVIMKLADQAAGAAAIRHAGRICVTASIDRLDFINAVHVGELVRLKASVNYVHRTSMEVGVRIEAENLATGDNKHVVSAYLIFVALDDECKPVPVAPVVPHSDIEKLRYRQAELRYKQRKENRAQQRALSEATQTR